MINFLLKLLLLFVFLFYIFFPKHYVFANDIYIDSFEVSWLQWDKVKLNPWEEFNFEISASNNYWEISSLFWVIDFWNNFQFSITEDEVIYRWTKWSYDEFINSSDYSDDYWVNVSMEWNNEDLYISDEFMDPDWFKLSSDASEYKSHLEAWFESDQFSVFDTKTIYANVKPYITDYYFEKSDGSTATTQVQWWDAETVNFVVEVKDYNWCSNIEEWNVYTDFDSLWLSSEEELSFQECIDDNTAKFRKTWITTNADLGTYTFSSKDWDWVDGKIWAIDADGNQNDPEESRFDNENKNEKLDLTVVWPWSPNVSIIDLSENIIWWPDKQSSTLDFEVDQDDGEYKISRWSDWSCEGWDVLQEWTSYWSWSDIDSFDIYTWDLNEWSNSIYVCAKNEHDEIGSDNTSITLDLEEVDVNISSHRSTINEGSSDVRFSCSKDSSYQIEVWGDDNVDSGDVLDWHDFDSTSISAWDSITVDIPNDMFDSWDNDVYVFCRDEASYVWYDSVIVNKTEVPPSMSWYVNDFYDCGQNTQWLDGRDFCVNWEHPDDLNDYDSFWSWRIYILPEWIDLNLDEHSYKANLWDKSLTSWNWTEDINNDSIWDSFQDGWEYVAWIYIQWSWWAGKWDAWSSQPATFQADEIENPTVEKASFVDDTTLRLETDTTLDTDTSVHSGGLIKYDYEGDTFYGQWIDSVDGQNIDIQIESLWNTAASSDNLSILTWDSEDVWAIRSEAWWFNNLQEWLEILDKQDPDVQDFSVDTDGDYIDWEVDWYSGHADFSWWVSEELEWWAGSTRIEFHDMNSSSQENINLTLSENLWTWENSISRDLSERLNCWTVYQTRLRAVDLADNTWFSDWVSNIWFDNCAPSIPELHTKDVVWSEEIDFSWDESGDDDWNGSGVDSYDLEVYEWSSCEWTPEIEENTSNTEYSTTLSDGDYSWRVRVTDNVGNVSDFSDCDDFTVDTDVPTIDNQQIFDTEIESTNYTREWRTVQISADITNTNKENVYLDLSSLAWNWYENLRCSDASWDVECTETDWNFSFNFEVWFDWTVSEWTRQVEFEFANESSQNTWTQLVSTTVDNTDPDLEADPIISPEWGETYWWDEIQIEWKSIDYGQSGRRNIQFEYATWDFQDWNEIFQASTSGPRTWDISDFKWQNNFQLRLTAKDRSHNTAVFTWGEFTIDRTPPEIDEDQINFEIAWWNLDWQIFKEWDDLILNWNTWAIEWAELPDNPLNLSYSRSWWDSFSDIESGVENSWTYTWSIPDISSSDNVLIKLEVVDEFDNTASIDTDTFVVDNTDPDINIWDKTPPNGREINHNWFDVNWTSSDNYMSGIYLMFQNEADEYWSSDLLSDTSEGEYIWEPTWNLICEDDEELATDESCDNFELTDFAPKIENSQSYQLTLKAVDRAGNETITTTRNYDGDTQEPEIEISTWVHFMSGDNIYFWESGINLTWTATDNKSISSVELEITNDDNHYWNWDDFQWEHYAVTADIEWEQPFKDWNYEFSPEWDTGDNFEVKAIAYDSSYKVNLTWSDTANLVLDKTPPTIEDDVFTFDTEEFYAGGDNLEIIWNTWKIYDDFSWLADNPINLYFDDWDEFNKIASSLPNSWSYEHTLPEVDTSEAYVRIEANDNVGNKNHRNSNEFQIDSTPPEIDRVETAWDWYWKINRLRVIFSKDVNMDSFGTWVFSSDKGITFDKRTSINDDRFELKFDVATGTTATRPTLSWSGWVIEDLAWNKLDMDENSMQAENKARPVVMNAGIFDKDKDWKFDEIQIEFSEDMQEVSDENIFSLNNNLAWLSIDSVSRDDWNNSIINISLSGQEDINTYPWNMTLDFDWNSSDYVDLADNEAKWQDNIELLDKANPILSDWFWVFRSKEWYYTGDTIILNFSESLSWTVNTWSFQINEWEESFDILDWYIDEEDNYIYLQLDDTTDTDAELELSYTGYQNNEIEDKAWNKLEEIIDFSIQNEIPPKLTQAKTLDDNHNWRLDTIYLKFSEEIDDEELSTDWLSVANYSISGVNLSWTNQVLIELDERSRADTDTTPEVYIWSNNTIQDTFWNNAREQSVTPKDRIGPVIASARLDDGEDKLFLTFSEDVYTELGENDFMFENSWEPNIDTIDFTTWNDFAEIEISDYDINFGDSRISFAANQVEDEEWNKQPDKVYQNISASVVINEIFYWDDEKRYIELRNLAETEIDFSDNSWKIREAWGWTLSVDDWSLTGEWYFLIWNSEVEDILDIDLDLERNDLKLDTENDLILEDENSETVDQVKSEVWKNDKANVAIERLDSCADGLSEECWYDAVASENFVDEETYKWTPGAENIFDDEPPEIIATPEDNFLYPHWNISLKYEYEDSNSGIDTDSVNIEITRTFDWWNEDSANTTNKNITESSAIYDLDLDYWKYEVDFEVSDNAGNKSSDSIVFYVDDFSFSIDTNDVDLGLVMADNKVLSDEYVTVSVETIWAWFAITHKHDDFWIDPWDWDYWYGGCQGSSCDDIENYENKEFVSKARDINEDGSLNTHTYEIRYWVLLDALQDAGYYSVKNDFSLGISY